MQVKSLLLFTMVGAVAVVAKKGESSEEIDGSDFQILDVWPYPRPYGSDPKPLKFKRPKHRPQHSAYVVEPHQNEFAPQVTQAMLEGRQFLQNIERKVQEVSFSAYANLQLAEAEFDRNRKNNEEYLLNEFKGIYNVTADKLEIKIHEAEMKGRKREEIDECVGKKAEGLGTTLHRKQEITKSCLDEATEKATKVVRERRNSFIETSVLTAAKVGSWAQQMNNCIERRNFSCAQEKIHLISQGAEAIMNVKNRDLEKLLEAGRKHTYKLYYCRENFYKMMHESANEYFVLVDECMAQATEQKPLNEADDSVEP